MTRVLVVSQYFDPESFKCNEIAYELSKLGYKVDVITGIPNYPNGKYFKGYGVFRKRIEKKNGVTIYRAFEWPRGTKSRKVFILMGYLTYALFGSVWAFFLALFKNYDVIIAHEPSPVFQVAPGMLVARMQRIPLYTWVLDLWPSIATYYFKPGIVLNRIEHFCKKMYRRSEKILISSEGFRAYIKEFAGVDDNKIVYFPNWSEDIKNWPILEIPKLPNGFRIMMAGNIGEAQVFPALYEFLLKFKGDPRFQWIFVGDGASKSDLVKFAQENGMTDTMTFVERHPFKYMPAFYQSADALFLTLKNSKRHLIITVPARFQSYLSAGKPIIGLIGKGTGDLIEDCDCGISADSENINELYNKVIDAYNNREDFSKKGANGLKFFYEKYTREKCINDLIQIIENQKDE